MEKRLLNFLKEAEAVANGTTVCDLKKYKKYLITQIEFFQHERLIHLLVTLAFAVFEFLCIVGITICYASGGSGYCSPSACAPVGLAVLSVMVLILLVPYVRHYYILENGVQKLYEYYDAVCEKCK